MSRGHGRIERGILAAFAAEPDNAFLTDELAERVYPRLNRIEKKHRVAVLRAAKKLGTAPSGIDCIRGGGLGGRVVVFDRYSVPSYAMARLKADDVYRPNDPRIAWSRSEAELRAEIDEGGRCYRHVAEGGAWWRHVRQWVAERDGDAATVAAMQAENDRLLSSLSLGARGGD